MTDYEAKAAAELKANLEAVETKQKPRHGRQPRKIGEMTCKTGVKGGWKEGTVSFVLRLTDRGEFIAEHGDTWYVSKSRDALKARMDLVAKVTLDLKWTRYLLIDYTAEVPASSWNRRTTDLDVDDARPKGVVVYGIKLTWSVVEFSDAIQLPGQGERFMRRNISEDGEPESAQETVIGLPDGLVVYTKEREKTLLRLRAALTVVDARMVELFHGCPEDVSRRFDEMSGVNLLLDFAGGDVLPKAKKPR